MEYVYQPQITLDNLSIRSRYDVPKEIWDEFVNLSPYAWIFHTYDMQDALTTWPGKSDLSFVLVDEKIKGEIVALVPLHRLERPIGKLLPNCHLESTGGFAYHPLLSQRQIAKVSEKIITILQSKSHEINAEEINISLTPLAPFIRGNDCPRVNPLVLLGMSNNSSQTYIINLQKSKIDIWNGMESYCRTHIRKAEKAGFSVRQGSGQKDLEIYYDLHCRTYRRTNVKPHPFRYFEHIWKNFVSTGRAVIFFAEKDGKTIAVDNEAVFKNAMAGWTAAGESVNTSGVNNLLHWTAIQWGIDHGFEFYDSGEGFPGEKDGKRKGLTDFKKSFGGELFPIFRGKIIRRHLLSHFRNLIHSMR